MVRIALRKGWGCVTCTCKQMETGQKSGHSLRELSCQRSHETRLYKNPMFTDIENKPTITKGEREGGIN